MNPRADGLSCYLLAGLFLVKMWRASVSHNDNLAGWPENCSHFSSRHSFCFKAYLIPAWCRFHVYYYAKGLLTAGIVDSSCFLLTLSSSPSFTMNTHSSVSLVRRVGKGIRWIIPWRWCWWRWNPYAPHHCSELV